jgi:kynureninase
MSRDQIHVSADKRLARRFASSGAKSLIDDTFALYLDQGDQLAHFRDEFSLPTKEAVWPELYAKYRGDVTLQDQQPAVYFAGNSLGLMPKTTPALLEQELKVWGT